MHIYTLVHMYICMYAAPAACTTYTTKLINSVNLRVVFHKTTTTTTITSRSPLATTVHTHMHTHILARHVSKLHCLTSTNVDCGTQVWLPAFRCCCCCCSSKGGVNAVNTSQWKVNIFVCWLAARVYVCVRACAHCFPMLCGATNVCLGSFAGARGSRRVRL